MKKMRKSQQWTNDFNKALLERVISINFHYIEIGWCNTKHAYKNKQQYLALLIII